MIMIPPDFFVFLFSASFLFCFFELFLLYLCIFVSFQMLVWLVMNVFKKNFCKSGGRNFEGKITIRHKGGGFKNNYKKAFLFYTHQYFTILSVCIFDSFRNSRLVFVESSKGFRSFFYMAFNFKKDIKITSTFFRKPLSSFLLGDLAHNLIKNKKSLITSYAKSAGCCVQVVSKTKVSTVVKIPSGTLKSFNGSVFGYDGFVFLPDMPKIYKAGQIRNKGVRPSVRGVAINPVDHPHGGGEGKSTPGRPSVSPWGLLAKSRKKK